MNRRGFLTLSAVAAISSFGAPALGYGLGRATRPSPESLGFSAHALAAPGFGTGGIGSMLYLPTALDRRLPPPVLVLLHGYSPRNAGRRGLTAWARDYGVLDAHQALLRTPRFRGMILVCPFTPVPYLDRRWSETMDRYVAWLSGTLLPRVRHVVPNGAAAVFGLAGVSMGGHVGLEVLARRPDLFSSFTALQAAIKVREARPVAARIHSAFRTRGKAALQIITSNFDTYRAANEKLFGALGALGVNAEIEVDRGWHTRLWMQHTGSRAMLTWQDRVLGQVLDGRTETLISATAERCPCASSALPQG